MDSGKEVFDKNKVQAMEEELERLFMENKELHYKVDAMKNNCINLHAHIQKIKDEMDSRTECISSHGSIKRRQIEPPTSPKTSRILVRTDADDINLILKDGYQWRKYGQKVTKDNPSPRAYFRCSRAPECPVKKKVQRCADDNMVLEATYDGEHNHGPPGTLDPSNFLLDAVLPIPSTSSAINPSQPSTMALDLTLSDTWQENTLRPSPQSFDTTTKSKSKKRSSSSNNNNKNINSSSSSNQHLEEYMAALMADPNFRAALASAVARSMIHPSHATNG